MQKQATVIVGSKKDAGRTNMKYITWLLLFFVLSCVFLTARNANAQQNLNDPKWGQYHSCLGWHHHLGEDVIEAAKASKDEVKGNIAVWIVHINAKAACAKYLPKDTR